MEQSEHKDYPFLVKTLSAYTGLVLLSMRQHWAHARERVIASFIARGMVSLESIIELWRLGNFEDCWVVHRVIVERLFHLHSLAEREEFEVFEEWSFIQQFEAKNRSHSDRFAQVKLKPEDRVFSEEQKERYRKLKRKGLRWSRPKAEEVAKRMGLSFLYRYSYDYASGFVHPLAGDGEYAMRRVTSTDKTPAEGQDVVLPNSVLAQTLLIQEGLSTSALKWRKLMFDFLEQCRSWLETGSTDCFATFAKVVHAGPDFRFCEQASNKE
jgi:hypothetical protein